MVTGLDDLEAPPAQALVAEQAILGAMMSAPGAVVATRARISADVFYQPRNALIFDAMCALDDAGHGVEPRSVYTELARRRQLREVDAVYLFELWERTAYAGNLDYFLTEVRSAAKVRAIDKAHVALGQALETARLNGDEDRLLDSVAEQSVALQMLADDPADTRPVGGLSTWTEFVTSAAHTGRWIVDGLIQHHDVVLILSAPGAGKSFLSRQVCIAVAAGVHPFRPSRRIPPRRTLLVDLENAPGQVAEETEVPLHQVKRLGDWAEDRGWVWMRPEGLNLRRIADAQLLERVIAETRPDIVACGSLYNAYLRGRDDWDTAAADVQDVFKRLRKRYGVAFWLEHHMPRLAGTGHTGTPFGGTSWERWPTHGRVLRRAAEKVPIYLLEQNTFRGDRGARDFPVGLTRGGTLPWTAIYDQDELDILIEAAQ
jgi:hypothetical protein